MIRKGSPISSSLCGYTKNHSYNNCCNIRYSNVLYRSYYTLSAVWVNRASQARKWFAAFVAVGITGLTLLSSTTFAQVDLRIISRIESSNNPRSIGDGGKALGLYQLHQDVVDEYNRFHNKRYLHEDAHSSTISQEIASWYVAERIPQVLRHFGVPVTTRNVIIAYNAGYRVLIRKSSLPKVTQDYLRKYQRYGGAL